MDLFSLEALDARSGDALLVHFGSVTDPRLLMVDCGFSATYDDIARPRLNDLRASLDPSLAEPLSLDAVIVSHVDDDHISGVVRMCSELRDARTQGSDPAFAVGRLWHNSFTDSIEQLSGAATVPRALIQTIEAEAAGIDSGRALRDLAEFFGLQGNPPFGGFVIGPRQVDFGHGLTAMVIGPSQSRLDELREEWRRSVQPRIEAGDIAEAAAYVDSSAPNLSSIVVHLEQGGRTMLLTGDGRGDDTFLGLLEAGLLSSTSALEVDILKLPHHGSDRTVDRDYFERIVADHYVISANGRHENPSLTTLQFLVETQGDRRYTVHLTYPDIAEGFFNDDRAANTRNYEVVVRASNDPSIIVELEGKTP